MEIFQHILKKPIKISKDGNFIDCEVINIPEPNIKNIEHIGKIQEIVKKSFYDFGQKQKDNLNDVKQVDDTEPTDEETVNQLINIMQISSCYVKCLKEFKVFLLKFANCDETKMLPKYVDDLDIKDFNAMMGAYIKKFLMEG